MNICITYRNAKWTYNDEEEPRPDHRNLWNTTLHHFCRSTTLFQPGLGFNFFSFTKHGACITAGFRKNHLPFLESHSALKFRDTSTDSTLPKAKWTASILFFKILRKLPLFSRIITSSFGTCLHEIRFFSKRGTYQKEHFKSRLGVWIPNSVNHRSK